MASITDLQKELEAKRARAAEGRKARDVKDLETLSALYDEHGVENVRHLTFEGVAPPLPGLVAYRVPEEPEWLRYLDSVFTDASKPGAAQAKSRAARKLASVVVLYPVGEEWEALVAKHAAIPEQVGNRAIEWAQGEVAAEGKG